MIKSFNFLFSFSTDYRVRYYVHICSSTRTKMKLGHYSCFIHLFYGYAGDVFMFSLGNIQIVHVTQPDMVREITTCTSLDLGKPTYQAKERGSLLGQGILTSNGAIWAHQRKILAPELYMEKVKV